MLRGKYPGYGPPQPPSPQIAFYLVICPLMHSAALNVWAKLCKAASFVKAAVKSYTAASLVFLGTEPHSATAAAYAGRYLYSFTFASQSDKWINHEDSEESNHLVNSYGKFRILWPKSWDSCEAAEHLPCDLWRHPRACVKHFHLWLNKVAQLPASEARNYPLTPQPTFIDVNHTPFKAPLGKELHGNKAPKMTQVYNSIQHQPWAL